MGVVYKVNPEIRKFILEEKDLNPATSCRGMAGLVEKKFQIKLSKSSINAIFKESGLSMPVGRRQIHKKRRITMPTLPQIETQPEEPKAEVLNQPIAEVPAQPVAELPVEKIIETPVEKIAEAPAEEIPPVLVEKMPEIPVAKVPEPVVEQPVEAPEEKPVETPVEKLPEPVEKPPIEKAPELPVEKIVELPAEKAPEPPVEKAHEIPAVVPPVERVEIEAVPPLSSEGICTGALLLKAADALLGGSYYFSKDIMTRLGRREDGFAAKTEALIYFPLLEADKGLSEWELLLGRKASYESIALHLKSLQEASLINPQLLHIMNSILSEVRCIRIALADGASLYLDGSMHTVWSAPHIPFDFSAAAYSTRAYINSCFEDKTPLVLFMAPGYDIPTKEFIYFLISLDTIRSKMSRLTLHGNKFEELETIPIDANRRRNLIFGMWPWQFVECRKVNKIGEFKPFMIPSVGKEFYLAEIQIDLSQPSMNQPVTINGCALKTRPDEKARLIILSNAPVGTFKIEEIADIYLGNWPNLEEAFQDQSRKIELFTYTATSQRFFSSEALSSSPNSSADITAIFSHYLRALDLYCRWHFMPVGYEEKDFSTMKERFYSLKAQFKRQNNQILVTFQPPGASYPFLKDLQYAVNRMNERRVTFFENIPVRFRI